MRAMRVAARLRVCRCAWRRGERKRALARYCGKPSEVAFARRSEKRPPGTLCLSSLEADVPDAGVPEAAVPELETSE